MGMVPSTESDDEMPRPQKPIRTPVENRVDVNLSAEDLEERLLVQELRRLNLSTTPPDDAYREEIPAPIKLPDAVTVDDFLEIDSSELMIGNLQSSKTGIPAGNAVSTIDDFERIGLEEFEEEEIRPVVLLSPKPKFSERGKLDRDFMSDLERRLEKEAEKSTAALDEAIFSSDDSLIKER